MPDVGEWEIWRGRRGDFKARMRGLDGGSATERARRVGIGLERTEWCAAKRVASSRRPGDVMVARGVSGPGYGRERFNSKMPGEGLCNTPSTSQMTVYFRRLFAAKPRLSQRHRLRLSTSRATKISSSLLGPGVSHRPLSSSGGLQWTGAHRLSWTVPAGKVARLPAIHLTRWRW